MKRINELFDVEEDFKVLSIHSDSREVKKDSIFFCVEGLKTDGHRYADDAVFQGAKCIVYSKSLKRHYKNILYIKVKDVLGELNRVSDIFYDHPSYKMTVFGVSGTTGKTVVSSTINNILSSLLKMGFVGEDNVHLNNGLSQSKYTTPETIHLHSLLSDMVKEDVKGVTIEITSHGLALRRVDSVNFDIAILTNIYERHLDFHGTFENLMKAHYRLFEMLGEKNYAILNADEVRFMHYLDNQTSFKAKRITYGLSHNADVMAKNIHYKRHSTSFLLEYKNATYEVTTKFISELHIYCLLAVICSLLALEMSIEDIISMIPDIPLIEGHMEYLLDDIPFDIIVDETPFIENYENVFKYAKIVKDKGRLVSVIGLSSKYGHTFRRELALLCDKYLDQVIFTIDNYDDEIEDVYNEMMDYISKPVTVLIENRSIAIQQAIELACRNDLILILGKGSKKYMRSATQQLPYLGDYEVARRAVKDIFSGEDSYGL